jgi:hypothetical protein
MRTCLIILSLLVTDFAASAGSVKVYIVPQTTFIPASGKVSFDIYWINESERPAMIPAFERYSFTFSPLTSSATVGLDGRTIDHPSRDRGIAGWAIVHDQTTIEIDAKPNQLVEISAEFHGDKSRFKSNTIVLRR